MRSHSKLPSSSYGYRTPGVALTTPEFLHPNAIDVLLRGTARPTLVNTILPPCYLFITEATLSSAMAFQCLLKDSADSVETAESGP